MLEVASRTEQILLVRIEFTKFLYPPASGPHDRLHQRGDLLERPKGVILPWEVLEVCVGQHQGVIFPVLNHGESRGQGRNRDGATQTSDGPVVAGLRNGMRKDMETIMRRKSGIHGKVKVQPCGF